MMVGGVVFVVAARGPAAVRDVGLLMVQGKCLADEPGAYVGLKRHSGHLGFLKNVGVARYRKIEIKELKPASRQQEKKQPLSSEATQAAGTEVKASNPTDTTDGWVSLFNTQYRT